MSDKPLTHMQRCQRLAVISALAALVSLYCIRLTVGAPMDLFTGYVLLVSIISGVVAGASGIVAWSEYMESWGHPE